MKPFYLTIIYLCLFLSLQGQGSKTVDVITPGSLRTLLTHDELTTITDLTLTGTIDARDFWTMRDNMPRLENVNMESVTIETYYDATCDTYYNKNEIPDCAFYKNYSDSIHTLKSIVLPLSTVIVRHWAFAGCRSLRTINFPASVTAIFHCAFSGCTGLLSIYCYASTPTTMPEPDTDAGIFWGAFDSIDKEVCVLYVPSGSKETYASNYYWSVFKNIVEMNPTSVDVEINKTTFTCYPNPFNHEMAVEITNSSLKEATIEIYSVSGQRIKTLAKGLKGANISLRWDGTDEQGQIVSHGVYLLKVNGQARKVVFGK